MSADDLEPDGGDGAASHESFALLLVTAHACYTHDALTCPPPSASAVYELDADLKPIRSPLGIGPLSGYYLGDQEAIKAKINAVANQAAVKKE